MKNRIFTILILTMLTLPCSVQAVDNIAQTGTTPQVQPVSAAQNLYKQPVSKRKIAKKFLYAMGGVATSSLIIFLLLTVYNKVRESFMAQVKTPDKELSLETPEDVQGAIKSFLNKTNWQ